MNNHISSSSLILQQINKKKYPISFDDILCIKNLNSITDDEKTKIFYILTEAHIIYDNFYGLFLHVNMGENCISIGDSFLSNEIFHKIIDNLLNEIFIIFKYDKIHIYFKDIEKLNFFFNFLISKNVEIKILYFHIYEFDKNNDEKITSLFDYIKKCNSLKEVYLKGSFLKNNHIELLYNSLKNNKNMRLIDVSHNNIDNESIKFLDDILNTTNIKIINISETSIDDPNFLNRLIESFFEYIKSGYCDDNIIRFNNYRLNLCHIFLMCNYINNNEINFNKIKILDLSENYITSMGANVLFESIILNKTIVNLSYVLLSQNNLDDTCMETLGNLIKEKQSIVSLFLERNKITDKGVEILCKSFIGNIIIKKISFNNNKNITNDSFIFLNEFANKSSVKIIEVFLTKILDSSITLLNDTLSIPLDQREIPLITNKDVKSASKVM